MYAELSDSHYTELRKDLLNNSTADKNAEFQKEFLEKLKNSAVFCSWFRGLVQSTEGEQFPVSEEVLTEHEYKDPPQDTEARLYVSWRDLPVAVACRSAFWGEVTLSHIENGKIKSSYLAASLGNGLGGLKRIERALIDDDADAINNCVLTALRRLGGLQEKRGNRSVYVDCPFGKAWWRKRLCEEIQVEVSGLSADYSYDEIMRIFRISQGYWENLIMMLVSRNSIVGDKKARDALVLTLIDLKEEDSTQDIFQAKSLMKLCRVLGVRAAWQEYGVMEIDELKTVFEKEIRSRKWP